MTSEQDPVRGPARLWDTPETPAPGPDATPPAFPTPDRYAGAAAGPAFAAPDPSWQQPPSGPFQGYPPPPYPGQTYPGQTYPGQTYPGQAYPGQAYPNPYGQPTAPRPYAHQAPPGAPWTQPYAGRAGFPPPGGAPQGPPPHWVAAPPRALSDGRYDPPPSAGRGWLVALLSVVGVVVVGLIAALAVPSFTALEVPGRRPGGTASPVPPSASASPTPGSPTAEPTPTMPSDPVAVLKKNPIYTVKVPAKCPSQGRPSSKAAFRTQVKALLACENSAWKKALAPTAVEFAKPKVAFYDVRTSTPCGKLGTTFPAAYCSADRTLYFSTASYQQGRYYRLAVAQFVMHEYAHHVQELAGIFSAEDALDESRAVTTRRVELQAHCMAHYQLTHSDLGFDSLDRSDAEYQFSYTSDAKGHGSVKAERYWGRRGLDASTIGACNTWKVKASLVK